MTTQKTRAVVKGLTKRGIQHIKCTERGAQRKARTVCARRVRKAAARRLDKAGSLGTPTRISHGFTYNVPSTVTAGAKKLGVRGHGGVTVAREASMLL
jgi:hypothetical protein